MFHKFAEKISNMLYRHVFDKISTEFHRICVLLRILQIYLNLTALQPREISQAISCIISIKQTGDLKFASGDYISPVG